MKEWSKTKKENLHFSAWEIDALASLSSFVFLVAVSCRARERHCLMFVYLPSAFTRSHGQPEPGSHRGREMWENKHWWGAS